MLEFAQTNVWEGSDKCVMNSASGAQASPRTTEVTVRGGPFEVTVRGGPLWFSDVQADQDAAHLRFQVADWHLRVISFALKADPADPPTYPPTFVGHMNFIRFTPAVNYSL